MRGMRESTGEAAGAGSRGQWSDRRRGSGALAIAALALLVALPVRAQAVRGVVVDGAAGSGLAGVTVVLLDSSDAVRAAALSDEAGKFVVHAPAVGVYRLKLEAVGFVSETFPPRRIEAGETDLGALHYARRRRELPAVTVTAKSRCAAVEGGALVAALWEEVRKALAVTRLTVESERYHFDLVEFERELDPRTLAVVRSRRWERAAVAGHPYESIDAESLAAHGYVRTTAEGTWYYAPDARTLLSDAFLRTHCFNPVAPGAGQGNVAGLAFAPTGRRKLPDVRGVLWLDAATSGLLFLEYRYTGLPRSMSDHDFGGRIDFARLSSGAWFVREWLIRMPRVSRQSRSMPSAMPDAGAARLVPVTVEAVIGVIERGGQLSARRVGGAASGQAVGSVAGTVYDSAQHAPLANAQVWLDVPGGAVPAGRAATDSSGRFRMDSVPPGTYTLTVSHPRLDALGSSIPPVTVTLPRGEMVMVSVTTPSAGTTISSLCGRALGAGEAVVRGTVVRAAAGEPVAGASVRALWKGDPAFDALGAPGDVTSQSDADGRFTLCGLPPGRELTIRASEKLSRGVPFVTSVDSGSLTLVTLLAPPHRAEIAGVVRGRDGKPLASAELRIDELDISVRSDSAGAYRLPGLPPGRHVVEARALGYAPETAAVAVDADGRATAALTLGKIAPVLQTVRTLASADRYRTGFGERLARRAGGHFLTREQIRRSGQTRVTDLLRRVPGLQIRKTGNIAVLEFTGRGGRTFASHGCPVAYAVDGVPYELAFYGLDGEIAVEDIEAIEVYDAATTPVEFSRRGTGCGVILIWSRQKAVDEAPAEADGTPGTATPPG